MGEHRGQLGATLIAVSLAAATVARAEPRDEVLAEQLFAAAESAMARGDFDVACRRYSESQRLDPTPSAVLGLAACQDRVGRVASAWLGYREALEILPAYDERRTLAEQRATELQPRLSRLELHQLDAGLVGVLVELDGNVVSQAAQGLPISVDPGPHHVSASAPGRQAREYFVTLVEGETVSLGLEPGSHTSPPAATPYMVLPPPGSSASAPFAPRAGARDPATDPRRTWGFVVGGVGALSLGIGAYAGITALSRTNDADAECSGRACSARGLDSRSSARSFATVADVGIVLGIAGLGLGGYLVLSSSDEGDHAAVTAAPLKDGAAVSVLQSF